MVDDLWAIGVCDEETTIRTLGPDDLKALKLDAAQLLELGKSNLRKAMVSGLQAAAARNPPGGVSELHGNEYASGLLAIAKSWDPIAEVYDGRLLVAAPADFAGRLRMDADGFEQVRGGAEGPLSRRLSDFVGDSKLSFEFSAIHRRGGSSRRRSRRSLISLSLHRLRIAGLRAHSQLQAQGK